jgi:hypothetical protein
MCGFAFFFSDLQYSALNKKWTELFMSDIKVAAPPCILFLEIELNLLAW